MEKAAKFVLIKTIPISLGYIFLGVVFGLLLQKPGLGVSWTFLISTLIYAGSVQFALVGILTDDLSYVTTAIMTLLINSCHAFYRLTFIERFKEMRKAYPYMVFSLTDETCSLLCSMARPSAFTSKEWKAATFFTAFFDQCYWITGSVLGALMSELITFGATGIDFTMTALFVVICIDQWKAARTHIPVATGFICGTLFLVLIRSSSFILPALAATVAMLLFLHGTVEQKMEEGQTMTHSNYVLITILICTLCIQITQWPPFLLFGDKKEVPGLVHYLGTNLSAVIIAVLVVYCLKGVTPLACPYDLPGLISVAVAVGLHLWEGNTLASIAPRTVCYILLVQMVF